MNRMMVGTGRRLKFSEQVTGLLLENKRAREEEILLAGTQVIGTKGQKNSAQECQLYKT
jgi:hypothetical protein